MVIVVTVVTVRVDIDERRVEGRVERRVVLQEISPQACELPYTHQAEKHIKNGSANY